MIRMSGRARSGGGNMVFDQKIYVKCSISDKEKLKLLSEFHDCTISEMLRNIISDQYKNEREDIDYWLNERMEM